MPSYAVNHYPEIAFGGYTRVDGTVAFFLRLRSLITPGSVVLDIGCGRAKKKAEDPVLTRRRLCNLGDLGAKIIGIDPDTDAGVNPLINEFRLLTDLAHWPVESESIDVAFADFVLEHVADPDAFFAECNRVLKPGGYLCLRTPNLLSYVGLLTWLIPNRFHSRITRKVQDNREEADVFPTLHRCNTRGKVRRLLRRHGFEGCVVMHDAEPSYFSFSRALYALAVLHQRWAPAGMRLSMQVFARKLPASA